MLRRVHHQFQNYLAYCIVKFLRIPTDLFFGKRYAHRAVILETVAGVPGMVGGMMQHFKSLRRCQSDNGLIKALLDEAENERMHLMVFIELAKPNFFERLLIIMLQILFALCYFILYLLSSRTAHLVVGYLENEAVKSYTQYLHEIDNGTIYNIPAPTIAIDYWKMSNDASLRDLVLAVREDEIRHRDTNHMFADNLSNNDKN
ncbi:MAG: oxidase [Rickettsiaceae bacterium]|nr:MAG: oxidase [Rickettsiaceae bacterium]